jgi:hypothetical protein
VSPFFLLCFFPSLSHLSLLHTHTHALHIDAAILKSLNTAIDNGDADGAMESMKQPMLGLVDVDDAGAFQYLYVLQIKKQSVERDVCVSLCLYVCLTSVLIISWLSYTCVLFM